MRSPFLKILVRSTRGTHQEGLISPPVRPRCARITHCLEHAPCLIPTLVVCRAMTGAGLRREASRPDDAEHCEAPRARVLVRRAGALELAADRPRCGACWRRFCRRDRARRV